MILWRIGGNYSVKEFSLYVTPGALFPDAAEFFDACGKPVQFEIVFRYGKTDDLPSNIARYLLDHKMAQETRFVLPELTLA